MKDYLKRRSVKRSKGDSGVLIAQAMMKRDLFVKTENALWSEICLTGFALQVQYVIGPMPVKAEKDRGGSAVLNFQYQRGDSTLTTLLGERIVYQLNKHLTHIIRVI